MATPAPRADRARGVMHAVHTIQRALAVTMLALAIGACSQPAPAPFRGQATVSDDEINAAVNARYGARLRTLGVTRIAAHVNYEPYKSAWEDCQDASAEDDDACYSGAIRASFAKEPPYTYTNDDLPDWSLSSAEDVAAAAAALVDEPAAAAPPITTVERADWMAMSVATTASGVQVQFPANWRSTKAKPEAQAAVLVVIDAFIAPLERRASWTAPTPR